MLASQQMPVTGLPNYDFSPDEIPVLTATDIPDHMEIDHPADLQNNSDRGFVDLPRAQRSASAPRENGDAASSEIQKQALGNLLGALMPNQNGQTEDTAHHHETAHHYFPQLSLAMSAPDEFAAEKQAQTSAQADYGQSHFLPFDNDDLSKHLSQNIDFPPHTSISGQNEHDIAMAHHRQNSNSSLESLSYQHAAPQQREFEAYARLQFEDGNYYLNTYACELGRDVLAYKAALQREREEKEAELNGRGKSRSSSGKASHRSARVRRQLGSQMQGSVVSEQGGFAGIDEAPMMPPPNPDKPTMSSQESESSVVKPAEYLINPRTLPSFDYHRSTEMQAKLTAQDGKEEREVPDDEQPVAVTAEHLPSPHMCPLIPIHGKPVDGQTDAELHKKISRRHIKIQWSFQWDRWEMLVLGRNGAYCNHKFIQGSESVPLHDGSLIQIAHIVLTFRLPNKISVRPGAEEAPEGIDADEALPSVERRPSESVAGSERRESVVEVKPTPKISLKISQKVEAVPPEHPVGPDGKSRIKRGPGRPPKDGIMSTRERKEREKAAKMAELRQANGGKTPPPTTMRTKAPKPTPPVVEAVKAEVKQEKRKYTKRKATDENGNPVLDADHEVEEGVAASDDEPKTKKARTQREKSISPVYPPRESLTAEQLQRPSEPYSQLLYKILLEIYPRALPLKDIYRELKKRYPYFVHEVTSEGWQSSVRHNLNSEHQKLFDKGDKEGKGFAWLAIPDAPVPQTEKKRTTQAAPQRPKPPQQRPQFQPLPGQNIQWQGTGNGAFPTNGVQQPSTNNGPWPQQGQANHNWQRQPVGNGQQQPVSQAGPSGTQMRPPSQTPQPVAPHVQGTVQGGQASMSAPLIANAPPAPVPPVLSSAASNMPCTLAGIEAIKRFETALYLELHCDDSSGGLERREYWHSIFVSSKKRILHGYPASTRAEGHTIAEGKIMEHLESFVVKFANPNFKGFTTRASQPNTQERAALQESAAPPVPPSAPSASSTAQNASTPTVNQPTFAGIGEAVEPVNATTSVAEQNGLVTTESASFQEPEEVKPRTASN